MKKINLLFSFIFTLIMGLSFVSCSHEIEPYDYAKAQKNAFKQSFEETFGTIASDQDWGFNNIEVFTYSDSPAMTRGHDVNRNEWYAKYNVPANVTDEEEAAVLNELATGNYADAKPTFDWGFYFVYHVHKGTNTYNDHNNSNIGVASDYMNHLQAVYSDGTMEHINDFNSGTQTADWHTIQGATVMINSTTFDFAYHNSRDSKYHNCYTIVDGADIGYPGFYYICFDFLANGDIEQPDNKNMGVDRNYNYTDWIVRICPATFNMDGGIRIIAEDLGAADGSDFDYNDVVFDVKLFNEYTEEFNYQGKLVGYFVLRAAGGTLPLTVAGNEVHQLFKVNVNDMVNTGAGPTKDPVQFRIVLGDADHNTPGATIVKNIPIVVTYKNGETITLATETGQAPEKIAVKPTTKWCKEYAQHAIYLGYPDFPLWVQDKTVNWQNNFVVEHLY
jgi:hypothetical protein